MLLTVIPLFLFAVSLTVLLLRLKKRKKVAVGAFVCAVIFGLCLLFSVGCILSANIGIEKRLKEHNEEAQYIRNVLDGKSGYVQTMPDEYYMKRISEMNNWVIRQIQGRESIWFSWFVSPRIYEFDDFDD